MRAEVTERVTPRLADAVATLDPPGEAAVGTEILDRVGTQAGRALDELRSIARGIYPPTLSDDGLASSVQGWLGRADVEAVLHVPAHCPPSTPDPRRRRASYFCALTVLAELTAHDATRIRLAVTEDPQPCLRLDADVEVPPGAEVLQDVTDRVEALDGTVRSAADSGRFVMSATLPVPGSAGPWETRPTRAGQPSGIRTRGGRLGGRGGVGTPGTKEARP